MPLLQVRYVEAKGPPWGNVDQVVVFLEVLEDGDSLYEVQVSASGPTVEGAIQGAPDRADERRQVRQAMARLGAHAILDDAMVRVIEPSVHQLRRFIQEQRRPPFTAGEIVVSLDGASRRDERS